MSRLKLLGILVLILFTNNAFSQGIRDSIFKIDRVQVTAKQTFKKEEAGMKATRIDTTVLQEKMNLSLSDVLSENTAVYIKNHGRGALATASFRGTAPSHTKVNWNGMNINNPMTGMVDFSLIPVYIIDEMNLKHGTASIENQSGGLGGAINIQNSANWTDSSELKYIQGVGSYTTLDELLKISLGNSAIKSKTRLYHSYSRNNYTYRNKRIPIQDPETGEIKHPLDTNENADYTRYGALQELYYKPNNKNVFSLKWWGQWSDRAIPRAISYEGAENSNINNQDNKDHKIVMDWKRYIEKGKLSVRSGVSRKDVQYVLKNQVPGKGYLPAVYSVSQQRSMLNKFLFTKHLSSSFSFKTSLNANFHDVSSEDTVKGTGYEKQREKLSWLVSAHKTFAERFNVNMMIRQDWVDNEFLPVVPYLGFDYQLMEGKEFFLKGNIARNYQQPSLNDLYWQPGGNPDLKPERGISGELGTEYNVRTNFFDIHSELTAYYSDINDWIIWIPSYKGYWEPQNIKNVVSKGLEMNVRLKGKISMMRYTISGLYSYTSSVNYGDPLVWGDDSHGKQLPYVPEHSGNVFVKLSYKNYFISFQHNYYSERYTTSSNDISKRNTMYPYFMNDLKIGREMQFRKFSLSGELKINNLFDETYHSILQRPMPGRNYMLMLMIKF